VVALEMMQKLQALVPKIKAQLQAGGILPRLATPCHTLPRLATPFPFRLPRCIVFDVLLAIYV
jgi:hypothetical protein